MYTLRFFLTSSTEMVCVASIVLNASLAFFNASFVSSRKSATYARAAAPQRRRATVFVGPRLVELPTEPPKSVNDSFDAFVEPVPQRILTSPT